MFYECSLGNHGLLHDPFKACIVPRPIGWISSLSRDGTRNLAPYSFFNGVNSAPPMVAVASVGAHANGGMKDTVHNIIETGEFVVNLATWDLRDNVNQSSAPVPRETDEFSLAKVEPAPCRFVRPPRVKNSPINMECTLYAQLKLPPEQDNDPNYLIIGTVIGIHIDDSVIVNGKVSVAKLQPIARLGYFEYGVITESFEMERPT